MKNTLLSILLAIIACSCDSTIHFYPEPQSSLVILQLSVDRTQPMVYKKVLYQVNWDRSEDEISPTRSTPYDVGDNYLLRIIVEVHEASNSQGRQYRATDNSTLVSRRVLYFEHDILPPQDTLHYYLPHGSYCAIAWSDYVPKSYKEDWHFNTHDLNEITMIDPETYPSNTHLRSTSCGSCEFNVDFSLTPEGFPSTATDADKVILNRTLPIFLSRPSGRFRIIPTDVARCIWNIDDLSVKVVYRQFVSTGYSAVRAEPTAIISTYSWSAPLLIEPYTIAGCSDTDISIVTDYIFTYLGRESRVIADLYFYDTTGFCVNECIGLEIPILNNHETIILGDVLTSSPNLPKGDNGVSIDEGFDGEIVVKF